MRPPPPPISGCATILAAASASPSATRTATAGPPRAGGIWRREAATPCSRARWWPGSTISTPSTTTAAGNGPARRSCARATKNSPFAASRTAWPAGSTAPAFSKSTPASSAPGPCSSPSRPSRRRGKARCRNMPRSIRVPRPPGSRRRRSRLPAHRGLPRDETLAPGQDRGDARTLLVRSGRDPAPVRGGRRRVPHQHEPHDARPHARAGAADPLRGEEERASGRRAGRPAGAQAARWQLRGRRGHARARGDLRARRRSGARRRLARAAAASGDPCGARARSHAAARRRQGAADRGRDRARARRDPGRGRRQAFEPQGHQPPRHDGAVLGPDRQGPLRSRGGARCRHRLGRALVRPAAGGRGRGQEDHPRPRRRDGEDREAAGGHTARRAGKPVVVATQMLESMISNPVPTRAEVSDVATAVFEGADAIMLSAESAAGKYPVESVAMMNRIAEEVESDPTYRSIVEAQRAEPEATGSDAIAAAARGIAETLVLSAILCWTSSGSTALRVARERPKSPIIAISPNLSTGRKLSVVWGVHCVIAQDARDLDDVVDRACRMAV